MGSTAKKKTVGSGRVRMIRRFDGGGGVNGSKALEASVPFVSQAGRKGGVVAIVLLFFFGRCRFSTLLLLSYMFLFCFFFPSFFTPAPRTLNAFCVWLGPVISLSSSF